MGKKCSNCGVNFGNEVRSEFIKNQFMDFHICPSCEAKVYVVIPPKNRAKFNTINILTYIIPLALALAIVVGTFLFAPTLGLFINVAIGAVLIGLIFVVRRKISRGIHWKYAIVQNSSFV